MDCPSGPIFLNLFSLAWSSIFQVWYLACFVPILRFNWLTPRYLASNGFWIRIRSANSQPGNLIRFRGPRRLFYLSFDFDIVWNQFYTLEKWFFPLLFCKLGCLQSNLIHDLYLITTRSFDSYFDYSLMWSFKCFCVIVPDVGMFISETGCKCSDYDENRLLGLPSIAFWFRILSSYFFEICNGRSGVIVVFNDVTYSFL